MSASYDSISRRRARASVVPTDPTLRLSASAISGASAGVHRAQVRRIGYASAERDVRVSRDSSMVELRLVPAGTTLGQARVAEGKAADVAGAAPARARRAAPRDESVAAAPAAAPASAPAAKEDSAPTRSLPTFGTARPDQIRRPGDTTGFRVNIDLRDDEPLPLATRAAADRLRRPGRSTRREAAGQCLVVSLHPIGGRSAEPRRVGVRMLPTVSRDSTLPDGFALAFPRAGDVPAGTRGLWRVVPRADETEHTAREVRLDWTTGAEQVVVRMDWSSEVLVGRASLRAGAVGVDARVTAGKVECGSLR